MSCVRCEAQLEEGDVRCPVCAQAVAAQAAFERPPGLRVLRCTDCGAALSYSAEKQNPACDFCGAVMRVEEPVDPIERPEGRVRMTVGKESARAALKAWLSTRGFFRPSDLASASTVDSLRPLWWAAWACEASATVSWTADSDAGRNRSDWAPHSGQTPMQWDRLLISASRGLTRRETDALVGAYDASVEPLPEEDAHVEQFELQRSAARQIIMASIEADAVARLQQGTIPGSRYRNVHASALLAGLKTRRLAMPVWLMSYRFKDTVYRAVVHGQNEAVVVGASPVSWLKVALVATAVAAVIAGIVALVILKG